MKFAVFVDDVTVEEARAFCPNGPGGGVSNDCSPSNKGTGAPEPPEPDGRVSADDSRGAVSGHSAQQREKHVIALAKWLKETHGIDMAIDMDSYERGGPPTMDSIRQIANGIEHLERSGMTLPEVVVFRDLPGDAPAAYDYISGMVMADPDGSLKDIQGAIDKGWLAGTLSSERWGLMVHEITHHDHREAIREKIADRSAITDEELLTEATISRVEDLMGRPVDNMPTQDPWDHTLRFGTSAGKSIPSGRARETAREVSDYATTNPLEFVAEVRTGLAAGITYSERVMKLYEDYGGPPLPRRRRAA